MIECCTQRTKVLFDKAFILYKIVFLWGFVCEYNDCWGAITQLKDVEIEIKNSTIENNKWAIVSRELSCQEAFNKINIENSIFSNNEVDIGIDRGWTSESCELNP